MKGSSEWSQLEDWPVYKCGSVACMETTTVLSRATAAGGSNQNMGNPGYPIYPW